MIEHIIQIYIVGLFILAVVSVYSLIMSRQNRLATFIMTPMILVMSLFTWQAVTLLQGTPILGLPFNEEVEVIYIRRQKPDILLLIKNENELVPHYYSIPWTEENSKKFAEMEQEAQSGMLMEGEFKPLNETDKNNSESLSFEFNRVRDYNVTNPK